MAERRGSGRRVGRAVATMASLALVAVAASCGSSATTSTPGTTTTTAPPGPSITIEPATGLTNGQTVTVTGRGFPANSTVGYAQCAVGGDPLQSCASSSSSSGIADASGAVSATVVVHAVIGTPGGLVDCSTEGACELLVGMLPAAAIGATEAVQVAPTQPSSPLPAPTCAGPYSPVGWFRGAVGVPQLPPNVSGTARPYVDAGAAVAVAEDGDDLVLTVAYEGATRTFTTAPRGAGSNYDRTPGPSDTRYGLVSIVTADDGAIYVTLEQNNSGDYARIGWRFDDPCAAA